MTGQAGDQGVRRMVSYDESRAILAGAGPSWWRIRPQDRVKRCPVDGRPYRAWGWFWRHLARVHGAPVAP